MISLPIVPTHTTQVNPSLSIDELSLKCTDPIWCNVEMPATSYYKFSPPTDKLKWKQAQIHAANGDQILLERIVREFPSPLEYIDGDRSFRRLHRIMDIFLDTEQGLGAVTSKDIADSVGGIGTIPDGDLQPWQKSKLRLVPLPFETPRAPIIQLGYFAFNKNNNEFFSGNHVGGHFVNFLEFLNQWNGVKHKIVKPFIAVVSLNENWGVFATMYPNRTAAWGRCCDKSTQQIYHEFLNHPMTLMMVINQHSNLSHPKIVTIPRGIPTTWEYTEKIVWDAQRLCLSKKRDRLLIAAASSWGQRPQILRCVSDKMNVDDFDGHVDATVKLSKADRADRRLYYNKIGSVKFGLSLPGFGYDCFRLWELMTMGSIAVIEKGVGMDRMLWRLPALLVEDFDSITPKMLREAYVEAMYRADEFEYHRLTQEFWYGFLYNVSTTMKVDTILNTFPMQAEDPDFTRARIPYECGKSNPHTCGPGTKRIPTKSC